jgi:hypothetical protein
MNAYSDPNRENDPYALPNVEVFYISRQEMEGYGRGSVWFVDGEWREEGYYYWYCLPGCLPDSEPIGPFTTLSAALEDARAHI